MAPKLKRSWYGHWCVIDTHSYPIDSAHDAAALRFSLGFCLGWATREAEHVRTRHLEMPGAAGKQCHKPPIWEWFCMFVLSPINWWFGGWFINYCFTMFYSHTRYLGSYNRHLWCVLLLFALCMNRFSSALRYRKVITPCPKRQMERVPDICRWALGLREKTVFCLQIVFHYFHIFKIFIIYLNSLEFPTPKCRDLLCSVYIGIFQADTHHRVVQSLVFPAWRTVRLFAGPNFVNGKSWRSGRVFNSSGSVTGGGLKNAVVALQVR